MLKTAAIPRFQPQLLHATPHLCLQFILPCFSHLRQNNNQSQDDPSQLAQNCSLASPAHWWGSTCGARYPVTHCTATPLGLSMELHPCLPYRPPGWGSDLFLQGLGSGKGRGVGSAQAYRSFHLDSPEDARESNLPQLTSPRGSSKVWQCCLLGPRNLLGTAGHAAAPLASAQPGRDSDPQGPRRDCTAVGNPQGPGPHQ